jgi:CO dehydrogenase/acetyl-CoA synthase beta subunit
MVPVPQELEQRVQQYIDWRVSSGIAAEWSEDSIAELYGQLDAASRAVVRTVAQGSVDDEPVTVARAAEAAGATEREALGIVLELVQHFRGLGGGPVFPLLVLDAPEGSGDDQRIIVMPRDGARVALAAAGRG